MTWDFRMAPGRSHLFDTKDVLKIPLEIVAIYRGMDKVDVDKMQELEIGPNRCVVHHTE
jgi:hypothetical protein